jgi:hypothetical protein
MANQIKCNMANNPEKPIVQKQYGNTWEFVYPQSIDIEKVSDEFWRAVDFLDSHDLLAEEVLKKLIAEHPYYITLMPTAISALHSATKERNSRVC